MIKRGDRIKLTERGARIQPAYHHNKSHVDWTNRRGVVTCVTTRAATILWDGRRSLDRQEYCLIEPAMKDDTA